MAKIITERKPCDNYHVFCHQCEYIDDAENNANIQAVRKRAQKHCIETGHTITAVKSSSITYKKGK